jgi:hypothetical protein
MKKTVPVRGSCRSPRAIANALPFLFRTAGRSLFNLAKRKDFHYLLVLTRKCVGLFAERAAAGRSEAISLIYKKNEVLGVFSAWKDRLLSAFRLTMLASAAEPLHGAYKPLTSRTYPVCTGGPLSSGSVLDGRRGGGGGRASEQRHLPAKCSVPQSLRHPAVLAFQRRRS